MTCPYLEEMRKALIDRIEILHVSVCMCTSETENGFCAGCLPQVEHTEMPQLSFPHEAKAQLRGHFRLTGWSLLTFQT